MLEVDYQRPLDLSVDEALLEIQAAVSDGAPGLIKAINELWPEADRQRCTVHRLRNIVAKLPNRPELHERDQGPYWAALDEATDPEDAERRLRQVVSTLEYEYPSAAACLAEDLPALSVHLKPRSCCRTSVLTCASWTAVAVRGR